MLKKLLLTAATILAVAFGAFAQGNAAAAPTADKATTAKPARAPIFRPTKDQIKQVQAMLKEKKLYSGEASGTYNEETRSGIKSFQKDNGLKETGTLNRATLEKFGVTLTDGQKAIPVLDSSFASTSSSKSDKTRATASSKASKSATAASTSDAPKRPAPFRATPDQVSAAQKMLKDGKMYTGDASGKLDDPTRESLKKYQEANKLKVTGTLNAATLEKMGITLTDKQKEQVAAQAAYDAAKKN